MPPPTHHMQHLVRCTGLRVREQDAVPLARWIEERMRALALAVPEQYGALLSGNSSAGRRERELLTVRFSNGETYFLRDLGQFDLLATKLLPDLIARRAGERRLRLWSAGCASGEEAYTLAMLMDELAPRLPGWDVLILGTDINAAALENARRGVYGDWSFRALDAARRERYFRKHGRGWEIVPRLRDMVAFRSCDLVGDAIPDASAGLADFDLILCRNVFIYLDNHAIAGITAKFAAALAEGGFLVTGHSELFGHDTAPLHVRMYAQSAAYEKTAAPALAAALPTAQAHTANPAAGALPAPAPSAPAGSEQAPARGAARADPGCDELMQSAWQWADRGMPDLAERDCRAAVALDTLDPRPYFLLAQLAQEHGESDQAKDLLKKVIYLDAAFVPAYLELGALYLQSDDHERAQRMFRTAQQALRKLPPDAAVSPYSDSTAADVIAYADRMLDQAAPASGAAQTPAPLLRRRA